MEAIIVIGLLLFVGALFYLIYHFIRKIKNRERTLSKKIFFPILIGGFLLFIIGVFSNDSDLQNQLNEALEKNQVLTAENEEFKSTNLTLEEANEKLQKEYEELTSKLADFDKMEQELKEQAEAFQKEKEELQAAMAEEKGALEKEVNDLKASNATLNTEVERLKNQVASRSSNSTTSAASTSSNSSSTANASSSGSNVYYKNCSAARAAGVTPLYQGEPGYASHLDRDGDGIACE
ncbi:excalibur calcium-binding domain-containing protein [Bacillus sp. FJAT-50079]|uniref:excalibur calcium-binding domain-containing protein n=1 Tax=Bacillus sp. FJAT-50079 TaxID=2833577 RepID=UPI001BCA0246|nr:excalibur calcium-binding domain-containing protein [Bacillus sp. FJAT-50079]MBS4207487.1 excalibur calcium-binding domain-containing protein [Bacillus sp. FJAT-50079]